MGMFDYVRCEYALPEGAPTTGYQTKDTDAQYLETYVIAEDGRLFDKDGEPVAFHGALNFYASNVSGTCGYGYITGDNRRAEHWDFTALYDHGALLKLEGGREPVEPFFDRDPLTREQFWQELRPTQGESNG